MPNSNRMQWPYPGRDTDPWWAKFESMVVSMDSSGYASREDRQLILGGGGLVSWNAGTGVLAWGDALEVYSPISGFRLDLPSGSKILADGEVLYVDLTRAPTRNVTLGAAVASQVPNTNDAYALAIRRGTDVYWRHGIRIQDGQTINLFDGGGGGSGGALFSWNHTDASQFTLTDPTAVGWTAVFVAATTSEPEHILVTKPLTVGPDTAFLTVTVPLLSSNYEVTAVHSFFGNGVEAVSVLGRVVDLIGGIFAGAKWNMGAGSSLEGFYAEGAGDTTTATSIEPIPSAPPVMVETQLSARGLLLGKGWGRLSNYGSIDASAEPGLGTSTTIGMRFTHAATASQTMKIYNFFAYQRVS